MPELSLIITLAIAVVSAVVIFRVAKGVIQGVLLASAVVSILTAVAGGLVVKDALELIELKDNFQKGDNMLLLSNDNWAKLTAGITIKGQAGGQGGQAADNKESKEGKEGKGGNAEALTAAELEKLNTLFAKKDYGAMRGKNYKLIIIKESSVAGSLPGSGGEEPGESINGERAAMLAALLGLRINQDPVFIISEYKKGNVVVYPETPVFKAMKLIPLSFFRKAAEKAFQQAAGMTGKVASKASAAAANRAMPDCTFRSLRNCAAVV